MIIKIISSPITKAEALEIAKEFYGDMVKGVVDIDRGVIALGGEYHIDANQVLFKDGSRQSSVWGFNIYPARTGDEWIEYTSLINIRPLANNRKMEVADEQIRSQMKIIIERLIQ